MNQPLRPMTLGEILDRTFQIYRAKMVRYWLISGTAALCLLAVRLANEFWWKIRPSSGAPLMGIDVGIIFFVLLGFHLRTVIEFLFFPPIVHTTSCLYLGESALTTQIIRMSANRWWANIVLSIFQFCFVLIIPEIVLILLFGGTGALEEAAGIDTTAWGPVWAPEMLFFLAAGCASYFWFSSCFGLSWSICRLENISPWKSLRRAWIMTRGTRVRICVAQLSAALLWLILNLSLILCSRIVFSSFQSHGLPHTLYLRMYEITLRAGGWVIATLTAPVYPIALTVFYYDQRIRKEGFDIEHMMIAAGMHTPPETGSAPVEVIEEQQV